MQLYAKQNDQKVFTSKRRSPADWDEGEKVGAIDRSITVGRRSKCLIY